MYTLLSCIGKGEGTGNRYVSIDCVDMTLSVIYASYSDVYLVVLNTINDTKINICLNDYKPQYGFVTNAIGVWLSGMSASSLIDCGVIPSLDYGKVVYRDLVQAGYKVDKCKIGIAIDQPIPASDKKDLYVVKDDVLPSYVNDYCLLTVNGFIHMTDNDSFRTYVIEGAKSFYKSNYNHAGLLSFDKIGKLTKYRITEPDISSLEDKPLSTHCYIRINTPLDLTDKSILLVLGGYMILPSPIAFFRTSANTVCLNLEGLPHLERIAESAQVLDLSSLGVNSDAMSGEYLFSDGFIKSYLTMSQSFIVIVDNKELFYNKISLPSNGYPGVFLTEQEPKQPLISGYGRINEYWVTQEDGYYSIAARETQIRNFLFSYVAQGLPKAYTDKELSKIKTRLNNAFLLEIGTSFPRK
jgi:hypothetical protein